MQQVELNTLWIVDGHGTHITQRCPQGIHARNDAELRNQRERQHQAEKNVACREDICCSVGEATVERRTSQEDEGANDSDPPQLAKPAADNVPRQISRATNLEGTRSQQERK